MRRKTRSRQCVVCGTTNKVQRHHLFPRVHYGQSIRINFCEKHHKELEVLIQSGERIKNGKRVKVNKQYYLDCVIEYITAYER